MDGVLEPMELGHLPYRKATYEDYVGIRGLKRHGKKKWRKYVADVVDRLSAALEPDEIVLGGGNVKLLKKLPEKCCPEKTRMRLPGVSAFGARKIRMSAGTVATRATLPLANGRHGRRSVQP